MKMYRLLLLDMFFFLLIGNCALAQESKMRISNNYKTGEFSFVYKADTTWVYYYDTLTNVLLKKEPVFITKSDQIPQRYKLSKNGNVFMMQIYNYRNKRSLKDTFSVIDNIEKRNFPRITDVIERIEDISYGSTIGYDSLNSKTKYHVFNMFSGGHNLGDGLCTKLFFIKKGLYLNRIEYFKRKGFEGKWLFDSAILSVQPK